MTDPHLKVFALTPPGTGLRILWHNAAAAIPPHAANHIAQRWSHYVAQAQAAGNSLFNGAITQLLGAELEPASDGQRLVLQLAPAEYKDFVVTRLRDRPWFEQNAPACAVKALGNSAFVTCGNAALLGRRSPRVSSYADRLHLIGGVLEALNTPKFPASRAGIEAHLHLELTEELGLQPGDERRDGWPRLLGLAEDTFLGQPELFWQWEVNISLEQLRARLDPAEHSAAVILQRDEMTPALWEQLTPLARQSWQIWTTPAAQT